MICTDKLLEGIKKSSCPQDILRGFSGLIRVYDWRGFNKFKPNPEYMDYIEIEAVKYIQPSSTPEEREDNVTVFLHAVTFLIDNQDNDVLDLLSTYVNIPVIIELQLEGDKDKFLRLFESTGAKMKPTVEFHGSKSGMVSVECTHYDPTIREERLPVSIERKLTSDITFLVTDNVGNLIGGASVLIGGNTYTTNANGEAVVSLDFGNHTFTVSAGEFISVNGSVFADGTDKVVNIHLSFKDNIGGYGYLYNRYVIHDPAQLTSSDDWRVPNEDDRIALVSDIGDFGGGKLKSLRTAPAPHPRWNSPNAGTTNEFNFNGLPSGRRDTGGFNSLGIHMYILIDLPADSPEIYSFLLSFDTTQTGKAFTGSPNVGQTIRLVRDATVGEQSLPNGSVITGGYIGNDGTVYDCVKIGSLVWIQSNLIETKYRDGQPIPYVSDQTDWRNLTSGARCAYNNDLSYV